MSTRAKGNASEQVAVEYLQSKGMQILDRNVWRLGGELDIVAQDGGVIVFVEVKSLHTEADHYIWETISKTKLRRIESGILSWLAKSGQPAQAWRFDFVGVVWQSGGGFVVEHLPNVEL